MPVDRVRIENVTQIPTKNPDVYEFTVYAAKMDKDGFAIVFQTFNAWKASLCEKARKDKRPIWITWKMDKDWKERCIVYLETDTTWRTV